MAFSLRVRQSPRHTLSLLSWLRQTRYFDNTKPHHIPRHVSLRYFAETWASRQIFLYFPVFHILSCGCSKYFCSFVPLWPEPRGDFSGSSRYARCEPTGRSPYPLFVLSTGANSACEVMANSTNGFSNGVHGVPNGLGYIKRVDRGDKDVERLVWSVKQPQSHHLVQPDPPGEWPKISGSCSNVPRM